MPREGIEEEDPQPQDESAHHGMLQNSLGSGYKQQLTGCAVTLPRESKQVLTGKSVLPSLAGIQESTHVGARVTSVQNGLMCCFTGITPETNRAIISEANQHFSGQP